MRLAIPILINCLLVLGMPNENADGCLRCDRRGVR